MQIIWHGHSCFELIFSRKKEEKVTVVVDLFSEEIGLKLPTIEADILLVTHSHSDHSNVKGISGNPFFITGPGEYEVKGIFIQGIEGFHDKTQGKEKGKIVIYTIEGEEIKLCHLGGLGQRELTSDQLEKIGNCDILMIPVGGVSTISAKDAQHIISQIEPKILIPMHYFLPKLKMKLEGVDKFLKLMGVKTPEILNKLTVKKKDLLQEQMKIFILKP